MCRTTALRLMLVSMCLLMTHFKPTRCHKILLFPLTIRSHILVAGRFGEALVNNGHAAHLLTASNIQAANDLDSRVKIMQYKVESHVPYSLTEDACDCQTRLVQLEQGSYWRWLREGLDIYVTGINALNEDACELLNDDVFIATLAKERYDVIVLDSVHAVKCQPILAYKLGLPIVILTTTNTDWFYRIPRLSHLPGIAMETSDTMTFVERLKSFATDVAEHWALNHTTYYSKKYVPEKPVKSAPEIMSETQFIFSLYDHVLFYPRPLMPNNIHVADLMARPGRALNDEYSALVRDASAGVILMSLGSSFARLQPDITMTFCETFNKISSMWTIIWHTRLQPNCSLASHVVVKPWTPQNDLLAQPKLKLFITHGGTNSYIEAVNHGKPMLVFPLALDRPRNARAMLEKHIAIRMNVMDFTASQLIANINTLLSNQSYTEAAQNLSRKFNARQTPVDKRISYWIEHVVQFGGDHLRTGAHCLNVAQFLMLDVYFFLLLLSLLLVTSLVSFVVFCVTWCFRRHSSRSDVKSKTD